MNGWFGNLSAGYGTDDRYRQTGMAGNFKQKSQITLLVTLIIPTTGFSDITGSMMSAIEAADGGVGVRRCNNEIQAMGITDVAGRNKRERGDGWRRVRLDGEVHELPVQVPVTGGDGLHVELVVDPPSGLARATVPTCRGR